MADRQQAQSLAENGTKIAPNRCSVLGRTILMTMQSGESSNIIWADKVTLGLAVCCAVLLVAFWSVAFAIVGGLGASHLWTRYGAMSIGLALLGLMASWLILRTLDFLAGGSTYRLVVRNALGMAAAIGKVNSRMEKLAHPQGAQIAR
jgi:hypothetical protein